MKKALVLVAMRTGQGFAKILQLLEDLGPDPRPMLSSMIYKRPQDRFEVETRADLVMKIQTSMSAEKLNEFFHEFKKFGHERTRQDLDFKILSFENEAHATPELTIPWPEMNDDLLILKCATEVWPDYQHPLLQQTLLQMLQAKRQRPDFEFLSQGPKIKSLE